MKNEALLIEEEILLSIIIPYYKTYEETVKLLDVLIPQLKESEIILIDDGCHDERLDKYKDKAKVIHLEENTGLSHARNVGIKNAQGQYIVFADSDDLVSNDYIETLLKKIKTSEFDYCYFSWKAINSDLKVIIKDNPPEWNWAVWNAIYKKDYVELFDDDVKIYEDVPWQKKMRVKGGKKEIIDKILYYYNNGRPGSLTDIGSKK